MRLLSAHSACRWPGCSLFLLPAFSCCHKPVPLPNRNWDYSWQPIWKIRSKTATGLWRTTGLQKKPLLTLCPISSHFFFLLNLPMHRMAPQTENLSHETFPLQFRSAKEAVHATPYRAPRQHLTDQSFCKSRKDSQFLYYILIFSLSSYLLLPFNP